MSYESLQTTVITILAIFGGISVLANGVKAIKELIKPQTDVKAKIEEHDKKLANDKVRLDDMDEANKIMLTCIGAMLDHEITGNSIEKLKKAKERLNEYLIER